MLGLADVCRPAIKVLEGVQITIELEVLKVELRTHFLI